MKPLLPLLAAFTLSACIEVDDSSNEQLVATLEDQNQILQQQLDNETASINIIGEVYNASTESVETSYEITVTVGGTTRETQLFTASTFEINNLPPSSDYSFVISSTNNGFMDRVVYAVTPSAFTDAQMHRSIGQISVAQAQEYSFAVKSSLDNSAVTNLVFKASSYEVRNSATPLGTEQYLHTSSYDQTTGMYSITLPENIHTNPRAKIDAVQSGAFLNQYQNEYSVSNANLTLQAEYLAELSGLTLNPDLESEVVHQNVTFRVSVFDDEGDIVPDLNLVADDNISSMASTFDETTQQYVLTGQWASIIDGATNKTNIQNQIRVLIPAFTLADKYYTSSYFNIYQSNSSSFRVSTSGAQNYTNYELPIATQEFNLVIQPGYSTTLPSDIEIVFDHLKTQDNNFEYSVFFSQPITLSDSGYYLSKDDEVTVIRGNESVDDLILPGSTLVSVDQSTIEMNAILSLSNTLVTFTSKSALSGGEYDFRLNQVLSALENETPQLVSVVRNKSFKIVSQNEFSITDIILDNANYYNEGVKIHTTNTAGDFDNRSQFSNSVNLYLPDSINSLKTLTLNLRIVTENGVSSNNARTFNLVSDGYVSVSRYFILDVADNENVIREGLSVIEGTTLDEGWNYRWNSSIDYLQDNTNVNKNSAIFDYAFETLDGVIETGQIELFVK
ncbi:MAG: hypothetical protein ACSHW0_00765 [Thalassotalea sp.]